MIENIKKKEKVAEVETAIKTEETTTINSQINDLNDAIIAKGDEVLKKFEEISDLSHNHASGMLALTIKNYTSLFNMFAYNPFLFWYGDNSK